MSKVIYQNPEKNLIILSSDRKATKEEQTKRLASYLATLVEWNMETKLKDKK